MPYTSAWIDPEIFLEHQGVTVYHSYQDNDVENQKLTYWYTISSISDEEAFDVRTLDVPSKQLLLDMPHSSVDGPSTGDGATSGGGDAEPKNLREAIVAVLKEAIELGLVKDSDSDEEEG